MHIYHDLVEMHDCLYFNDSQIYFWLSVFQNLWAVKSWNIAPLKMHLLTKLQILKQALGLQHKFDSCLKSCAISSILLQKYACLETLNIRILLNTIYCADEKGKTISWTIWNDKFCALSSYDTITRTTPNLSNFSKKALVSCWLNFTIVKLYFTCFSIVTCLLRVKLWVIASQKHWQQVCDTVFLEI